MRKAIHEAEETMTEKAWKSILKTGGSNSSSFWAARRKSVGNHSSGIECVQDTHGATTTYTDIVKESVANYFEALYQMYDPLDFGSEC